MGLALRLEHAHIDCSGHRIDRANLRSLPLPLTGTDIGWDWRGDQSLDLWLVRSQLSITADYGEDDAVEATHIIPKIWRNANQAKTYISMASSASIISLITSKPPCQKALSSISMPTSSRISTGRAEPPYDSIFM